MSRRAKPKTPKITCIRCREDFGPGPTCTECGVARGRVVRRIRRRLIGGKRGRNSGKVNNAKAK